MQLTTFSNSRLPVLVTTCAVLLATPLLADQLTARITTGPLNIQLTDLDPSDGIEPSFRWTQDAWTEEVERQAYFILPGITSNSLGFGDPERTQIAGDFRSEAPSTTSYVDNLGDLRGLDVFLTMDPSDEAGRGFGFAGINLEPSQRFNPAYEDQPASYWGSNYSFELSPNTAVLFSVTVDAEVTNQAADVDAHEARVHASMVTGDLQSEEPDDFMDPLGNPFYARTLDNSSPLEDGEDFMGISTRQFLGSVREATAQETLTVEYYNDAQQPAFGWFYLHTSAQIDTSPVTVPEPAAATLLTLLVVAGASCRSRRTCHY